MYSEHAKTSLEYIMSNNVRNSYIYYRDITRESIFNTVQ